MWLVPFDCKWLVPLCLLLGVIDSRVGKFQILNLESIMLELIPSYETPNLLSWNQFLVLEFGTYPISPGTNFETYLFFRSGSMVYPRTYFSFIPFFISFLTFRQLLFEQTRVARIERVRANRVQARSQGQVGKNRGLWGLNKRQGAASKWGGGWVANKRELVMKYLSEVEEKREKRERVKKMSREKQGF